MKLVKLVFTGDSCSVELGVTGKIWKNLVIFGKFWWFDGENPTHPAIDQLFFSILNVRQKKLKTRIFLKSWKSGRGAATTPYRKR